MKDLDHYAKLPRKRVHVAALIFNELGRILLVKPSYKDKWSLPGGSVEAGESPLAGCVREAQEETGIVIREAKFLCVQYVTDAEKGDALFFMFDCGVIDESQLNSVSAQTGEIEQCMFVDIKEINLYVPDGVATRIKAGLDAKRDASMGYVERNT